LQKTDVAEVPRAEAALPNVEVESSVVGIGNAQEDQHLADAHRLKKVVAYVKEKPKSAGDSARGASAVRMERFRANKDAQGLVQAYVPADILSIAKTDGGDWESVRVAVSVGRRALALRGWRAKVVALILPRS
jgi:hypothetical protein